MKGRSRRSSATPLQVLFGAPGDQPDHAARAVACARDLDAFAEALRERWFANGVALGATRIGVHAGAAIVGNFGGSALLRLHRLRRHGKHRGSAGGREQAARHARLHQRRGRGTGRRFCRPPDRRPAAARTQPLPAHFRAGRSIAGGRSVQRRIREVGGTAIPPRCPRSPHSSAPTPTMRSPISICAGCSMGRRGR